MTSTYRLFRSRFLFTGFTALLLLGALLTTAWRTPTETPASFTLRDVNSSYALLVSPETMTAYYLQYREGTAIPNTFERLHVEPGRVVFQETSTSESELFKLGEELTGLTELSGAVVRALLNDEGGETSIRSDWHASVTTNMCGCAREGEQVETRVGGVGSTGSTQTTKSPLGEESTCSVVCANGFYSYCNN